MLLLIGLAPYGAYSQVSNAFSPAINPVMNIPASTDTVLAQYDPTVFNDSTVAKKEEGEYYDEVPVTLNVQRIGSLELQAVIYGQQLYLPVKDLFDFLKLYNTILPDLDRIQGFFILPKDVYSVDKTTNTITYQGKVFVLKPLDLIRTETNLYLRSDYFGKVFGLDCIFDFRSLSVILDTKIELPAIREMQQELMRRNISRLRGERKADTTIARSFPAFHLGMADWSVITAQETNRKSNTRANLGIGGIVAGGELKLSLNYNSDEAIDLRQQFYQWRLVNNDHSALRQVTAGKIFVQSTASVFAPVTGIAFTNSPTTYKKSFGTYTLSNTTEPGWTVELYVNNVLVNYTKADASGFYTFQVPMVYGNSVVKLRFFGPWGEERTSERFISIPFNFVPLHKLEYNVTAGVVDDIQQSRYARSSFSYGLARSITLGGGVEYVSSVTSGKYMPFINVSASVGQHILVAGEHTYGVRSKAVISYRTASNLQLEINYARYDKDQTAVSFNYLEEKKIVLSMPIRGKKFNAFSRFTLNQFTLPYKLNTYPKVKEQYTSAEFLFSSVFAGISSNLTTYAVISKPGNPLVYSNLSFTFRLPGGIRLTPQVQYEYMQKDFSMIKGEIEKNIFNRGFLNLSYEKTLKDNTRASAVTLGFRYNLSFASTFFSSRKTGQSIASTQSARGSLVYDSKSNYFDVGNQPGVGTGGLIILPFLDLNCNGRRDRGEPKAFGLNLRINGGRLVRNDRDTTLRITGLEAYSNYFLELDKSSFDNVAWQITKETISITIQPNSFKLIEVAVAVWGEAAGSVVFDNAKDRNGLGRIIVNFYDSRSILAGKTITETDGYFSFMKLAPGTYTAQIDPVQLQKLQMVSSPAISFKVLPNRDGDVMDGLHFILQAAKAPGNF